MNLLQCYAGIEKQVCDEIRAWSSQVLEEQQEYFNELPACPYAKAAWERDRVAITFKKGEGWQDLWSAISQFPDGIDIGMVVDLDYQTPPDSFHEFLDQVNEAISCGTFIDRDIWVMGFHPEDEANSDIDSQGFTPLFEEDYTIIFVQRLTKLHESADALKPLGYYDQHFSRTDAEDIWRKREDLYRRLKKWQG